MKSGEMTDRELMQKALDALEYASEQTKPENLYGCDCLICKTILALRDRLAQPEKKEEWQYVQKLNAFSYPRQWVKLTDEEIGVPTEPIQPNEAIMFARVIEALIKGKNT